MGGIKQWLKEKRLGKWLKKENLIVLVLSGVLLFIIALPTKEDVPGTDTDEDSGGNRLLTFGEIDKKGAEANESDQAFMTAYDSEYAANLEQRLTEVLSEMEGLGRVRVMITLKSSQEQIVERENPVSRSTTNESDAQGGSRILSQVETQDTVVYRTEGSASEPYVVKTLAPEIEGVVVVAQGAGSGRVNKSVTEIVQALFGVEAHKVKVVKMESQTGADE